MTNPPGPRRLRRAVLAGWHRLRRRSAPPQRSQQELCETAMALLTLWATFDDTDCVDVPDTTQRLLGGLNCHDLSYLVLHLAGLSRALGQVMSQQEERDVELALQTVARGVHDRGVRD